MFFAYGFIVMENTGKRLFDKSKLMEIRQDLRCKRGQQTQHPRAKDHQRNEDAQEFRDKRQRLFMDLGGGLKNAYHQADDQPDSQDGRGNQ